VTAAALTRLASPALLALLALLACLFAACATEPAAAPAEPAATTQSLRSSAEWLAAIEREIGDAACETSAQCRTIGVGAKACGGPQAYLAWSSEVSDPARLAALVSGHREARRLEVERSGLLSDCRITPDPGAACTGRASDGKRVCQLGQRGRASLR